MPTPREILSKHEQHYRDSCAASGMEMVLKLHGLELLAFRGFQDRYGDRNIGFEKLADLLPYGLEAKDCETAVDDGLKRIEEEAKAGRFPLVSLPGASKWHIWIAVIEAGNLRFLSRDYRITSILDLVDSPGLRHTLATYRQGKVHFASYEIKKALQATRANVGASHRHGASLNVGQRKIKATREKIIQSLEKKDFRALFMEGGCSFYALALAEKTGLPLFYLCFDGSDDHSHVFAMKDGTCLDYDGKKEIGVVAEVYAGWPDVPPRSVSASEIRARLAARGLADLEEVILPLARDVFEKRKALYA